MKDTKIQWHPGFVAAMNLQFKENRKDLIFEKEHNLNTKPLEEDLLIIKKDVSTRISNEIGTFFPEMHVKQMILPFPLCGRYIRGSLLNISGNMVIFSKIHGRASII